MPMPTAKPRANDDGVLLLIKLRREHAKEAMRRVVGGFITFPVKVPSATLLLDYLSNMVSCLELMLKLLSGDWGSHKVGEMYKKVFGSDYAKSDLMDRLKDAIMDQKYLVEPASGIAHHIPELEELFHALEGKVKARYSKFSVQIDYELPRSVGEFLRDHAGLFYHRPGRSGEGIDAGLAALRTELDQITKNIDQYLSFGNKFEFHLGRHSIT
jgi:hypothetical protein